MSGTDEIGYYREVDEANNWVGGENGPAGDAGEVQNDLLGAGFGTCAFVECGNFNSIVTTVIGDPQVFSDGEIEAMYGKVAGFIPTKPETDHGAAMEAVLKEWLTNGWVGDPTLKPIEYHAVGIDQIRETILAFGACFAWFRLPKDADGNWDLSDDAVRAGSAGLGPHAMLIVAAGPGYYRVVTWKTVRTVSDEWLRLYGRGFWAVLHPAWRIPEGVTV